jgi:hypothetical protein
MAQLPTSPCYLILCDGELTTVIEKELIGGRVRNSKEFIVHTNNDTKSENPVLPAQPEKSKILEMEVFIEESEDRRACFQKKWDCLMRRHEKWNETLENKETFELKPPMVREDRLREWVRAFPIMNECTHFACLMDAKTGTIRFLERGSEDAG